MNWLDIHGFDDRIEVPFSEPDFYHADGYNEDDAIVVCPYIDLMPEESHKGGPKNTIPKRDVPANKGLRNEYGELFSIEEYEHALRIGII